MTRIRKPCTETDLGLKVQQLLQKQDWSLTGLMRVTNATPTHLMLIIRHLYRSKKIHVGDWTVTFPSEKIWSWGPGTDGRKPNARELLTPEKPHADIAASWMRNPLPEPQGRVRVRANGTKVIQVR